MFLLLYDLHDCTLSLKSLAGNSSLRFSLLFSNNKYRFISIFILDRLGLQLVKEAFFAPH